MVVNPPFALLSVETSDISKPLKYPINCRDAFISLNRTAATYEPSRRAANICADSVNLLYSTKVTDCSRPLATSVAFNVSNTFTPFLTTSTGTDLAPGASVIADTELLALTVALVISARFIRYSSATPVAPTSQL